MSRSTKRAAVVVALALLAGVSTVTGGSPAAGEAQTPATPPRLQAITLPEGYTVRPPASGSVSPGYRGSSVETMSAETNDGTLADPLATVSLGTESVIGPVDGRFRVTPTNIYPARAIGQIEASDTLAGDYICSGWLIDANTILTAGHCVYPPDTTPGNLAETLVFAPGRDGASDPYGTCFGTQVFSPVEWTQNYSEYADWALVHLDCDVGMTTGWLPYAAIVGRTTLLDRAARVQGYAGDKPSGTMWAMNGRIKASQKKMVFYGIDTFGGQSGSPVFVAVQPGCSCVGAIHAYGNGHASGPHLAYNHAPRITMARFALIQDLADNNG